MSREARDGTGEAGGGLDALQQWLSRAATALAGTRIHVPNYDPERHGRLVADRPPTDEREIERYWLNAPFAYATISYDDEENEHRYRVVEPSLNETELDLLERVFDDIRDPLLYRDSVSDDPVEALREELRQRLEEYGVDVGMETFYRLFYYLHRAFLGYGKLDPLMHDPGVEDISCDGSNLPVFVYHEEYADIETNVVFEADSLNDFEIGRAHV